MGTDDPMNRGEAKPLPPLAFMGGTQHFCEAIEAALAWDAEAGRGPINPESMLIVGTEFDFSKTQSVYERNGVKVTSFPVVHLIGGAVG